MSAVRRLLFLCTGNSCRSPLAAALARDEAVRRGIPNLEVRSAGTHAWPGLPASALGMLVAREHGLDLGEHRTTELDFDLLSWAQLVLAMAPAHGEEARRIQPAARVEVVTAFLPRGHPARGRAVPDPIGGGRAEYEATYELLLEAIRGFFEGLEAP